jgi:hypothetical protein
MKKFMFAVSEHEIAMAVMEGAIGLTAPPGTDPEAALQQAAVAEPEMVAGFYRAARKVMTLISTGGPARGNA